MRSGSAVKIVTISVTLATSLVAPAYSQGFSKKGGDRHIRSKIIPRSTRRLTRPRLIEYRSLARNMTHGALRGHPSRRAPAKNPTEIAILQGRTGS